LFHAAWNNEIVLYLPGATICAEAVGADELREEVGSPVGRIGTNMLPGKTVSLKLLIISHMVKQ